MKSTINLVIYRLKTAAGCAGPAKSAGKHHRQGSGGLQQTQTTPRQRGYGFSFAGSPRSLTGYYREFPCYPNGCLAQPDFSRKPLIYQQLISLDSLRTACPPAMFFTINQEHFGAFSCKLLLTTEVSNQTIEEQFQNMQVPKDSKGLTG